MGRPACPIASDRPVVPRRCSRQRRATGGARRRARPDVRAPSPRRGRKNGAQRLREARRSRAGCGAVDDELGEADRGSRTAYLTADDVRRRRRRSAPKVVRAGWSASRTYGTTASPGTRRRHALRGSGATHPATGTGPDGSWTIAPNAPARPPPSRPCRGRARSPPDADEERSRDPRAVAARRRRSSRPISVRRRAPNSPVLPRDRDGRRPPSTAATEDALEAASVEAPSVEERRGRRRRRRCRAGTRSGSSLG